MLPRQQDLRAKKSWAEAWETEFRERQALVERPEGKSRFQVGTQQAAVYIVTVLFRLAVRACKFGQGGEGSLCLLLFVMFS